MEKLLAIMAMLRDREYGCSWDLEQTFETIAPHTLEEVYEVVECIEQQDYAHLPNELGDLLFQIVFYAQMGKEQGWFDFNDVVEEISDKLVHRHPHVFPKGQIENFGKPHGLTPEQVEANWELIKQAERDSKSEKLQEQSVLDDIPSVLPALLRARKVQSRAANTGFDWKDKAPVLGKVKEEIQELEEALQAGSQEHILEEFGDILFSMVNLARHLKINPEEALRKATGKFEYRFREMEKLLFEDSKSLDNMSLAELDEYWNQIKSRQDH